VCVNQVYLVAILFVLYFSHFVVVVVVAELAFEHGVFVSEDAGLLVAFWRVGTYEQYRFFFSHQYQYNIAA
jgi:hypothetical protein